MYFKQIRYFSKRIYLKTEFKFKSLSNTEIRKTNAVEKLSPPIEKCIEDKEDLLTIEFSRNRGKRLRRFAKQVNVEGEILYGFHPVAVAMRLAKRSLHRLYLKNGSYRTDIIDLASARQVPIQYVDRYTLDYLSNGHVHQGICMDVGPLHIPIITDTCFEDSVLARTCNGYSPPLWLLMENVKDPMNFGAILRSANYFGVDRIFCSKTNSCKLSPVVSKASAGAMESVILSAVPRIQTFIQRLHDSNWCIVGTTTADKGTTELQQFIYEKQVLLILGNEGSGICQETLRQCDILLSIEPASVASHVIKNDCLSVSAAAAVLFHSFMRKRYREGSQTSA